MSAWRRVAIALFPERRRILENSRDFTFSVWQSFFDLLPDTHKAHEQGDDEFLRRVYQYAEWCWRQKHRSRNVYNAVRACFYEHLVDRSATLEVIPAWVKPEIFADIRRSFPSRMTGEAYKGLLLLYNAVHSTEFED